MRARLWYGMAAVLTLAAAIFGLVKRQTYTDLAHREDLYSSVAVAELPESIAVTNCEDMRTALPAAPLILRVRVLEEIEYITHNSRLKVRVEDVFSGTDCRIGDEICLTGRFYLGLSGESTALECFFVNIPKVGEDYLVFVGERVESYCDTIPVFRLFERPLFAPIFCYQDGPCTILPVPEESTYVPYEPVRGNEFFVTSEKGLQAMMDLKHEMLERYPMR